MSKLVIAAGFAAVMLTSFSTVPAWAGSEGPPDHPCTGYDCECKGDHCEPPPPPPPPPPESMSENNCGDELGQLSRVYPAEVMGITEYYRVWVVELCPTSRSDGNAAYLRPAISHNEVLTYVLGQRGYHAADVFAVQMMGEDTIKLYVHRYDDH